MKVRSISTNIFQLTQFGLINCYLVREDDGFTLIDAATGGQAPVIMQEAQKLGQPIVRLALTHAHDDHVGSLDALHTALPAAPVALGEREARVMQGDKSLDPTEPQTPLRGGYSILATKPTRLLREGDRIGSLEVINTPGHSVGHIAFLDTRDRSLIAGDAFQTQGGVAVSGTFKLLFPLPAFATWHKESALASARKLLALQPSLLAVGHGRALIAPEAAMEQAIRVMEQALAKAERKQAGVA